MRSIWLITLLLIASSVHGQGKIREVYAPREVVGGDTFAIAIVANAPKPGIERIAAISMPQQAKFVRAFLSHGALEEPEPAEIYPEGSGYFAADPGRKVWSIRQAAKPIALSGAVVYYFVFVAPEMTTEFAVRAALAEKGQEVATAPEPVKPKKGKKASPRSRQVTADPHQWQLVSPASTEFRFAAPSFGEFEKTVRCVAGWDNNSRAIILGKADLLLAPEYVAEFFSGPFTIEWWQQTVAPSKRIMTILGASGELLEVATNVFGQLYIARSGNDASLISKDIVTDGEWHHIVWSRDAKGFERLFVDAVPNDTITHQFMPDGIASLHLGGSGSQAMIDELHLMRRSREDAAEFAGNATIAIRDTQKAAFAIFHFEEYSNVARSSIPLEIPNGTPKPTLLPITLKLDGKSRLKASSSPVILEHAVLSLDQTSSSKVGFAWRATSEYDVDRYELQRRIATFGSFEKVLSVPARQPIKKGEELVARTMYSASEKLPALKRGIDLYYRLATFGKNDSMIDVTLPMKFELGGQQDIFLEQNKPNPFNPKTTIGFTMKKAASIKLSVFDIIGREVLVVANKKFTSGRHAIEIDATNWPGGIYFYKLKSGRTILTRRMVLAK